MGFAVDFGQMKASGNKNFRSKERAKRDRPHAREAPPAEIRPKQRLLELREYLERSS